MRDHLRVSLLCVSVLGAHACGDGSSGGVTVDELAAKVSDIGCDLYVSCGYLPDKTTCQTLFGASSDLLTLQAEVKAKTVDYDPAKASQCLDQLTALTSKCQFAVAESEALQETCDAVFTGHVADGGPCFFSDQCAGKAHCDQDGTMCTNACCRGVCRADPAPIAAGQPCDTSEACAKGLFCHFDVTSGAGGTCTQPLTTPGAACDGGGTACAAPLVCAPNNRGGAKTTGFACLNPAETGGDCSAASGNYCSSTRDRCDLATGRCVHLGTVGEACDPATMGDPFGTGGCMLYARCDDTTKTCVLLAKAGEPCNTQQGRGCLLGMTCDTVSNTCQRPADAVACTAP